MKHRAWLVLVVGLGIVLLLLARVSREGEGMRTKEMAKTSAAPGRAAEGAVAIPAFESQYPEAERRVVALPSGEALNKAEQVCRRMINNGFVGEIQQKFPGLTREQLGGLFLDPKEEVSADGKTVVIATGIRFTQAFPQAKAVADYCEAATRRALARPM